MLEQQKFFPMTLAAPGAASVVNADDWSPPPQKAVPTEQRSYGSACGSGVALMRQRGPT